MGDLLKKADIPEYSDDAWREILRANGFAPSGVHEEVWRSPHSDLQIRIDVDRDKGEPYYQIVTEDGTRSAHWTDSEDLKRIVEPGGRMAEAEEPTALSPEEEREYDEGFMREMKIVGRQRTSSRFAGRIPQFSFTVPTKSAATVAFHLAKAGMKDFDVEHYKEEEASMFTFPSEPEMHVAEEIVKAEYAEQIRSRKGLWSTWSDPGRNPFEKFQRGTEPSKYVASEEKPRPEITDDDLPEGMFSDKTFEEQRREKGEPPWEPHKYIPSLRPTAHLLKDHGKYHDE